MSKGIIGKKVGMTQIFVDRGQAIPVTVIEAGPCFVTQIKDVEKDGYRSVQLGFGNARENKTTKALKNHCRKARQKPKRYFAEVPMAKNESYELGQKITVDIFEPGEMTDVTGISKGKGFAGVVKRHGFSGGPKTHGSRLHRAPGSIGACATPSRVTKGKKMPGHMGSKRITVHNVKVVKVLAGSNILVVKGPIPGANGGLVLIKEARRTKVK